MIIVRVTANRLFIVSEYWILLPLGLYIDYKIITRMLKNRAIAADIEETIRARKKEIEIKQKQLKIFALATGSMMAVLATRGGQEMITHVSYPDCKVEEGLRYVDSDRLRKVIYTFFKHKQVNGVVSITKSALCRLVEIYGLYLPATPIPIPDFLQLTSYSEGIRKVLVTALLVAGAPLTLTAGIITSSLGIVCIIAGFYLISHDLKSFTIPTSLVVGSIKSIRRRIPDLPDVVCINLKTGTDYTIEMPKTEHECLLSDQRLTNPKCKTGTEINVIPENIKLNYDDIVNMRDVSGFKHLEFSDKYEVNPNPKKLLENLRGGSIPKFLKKIKIPNKSIIFYLMIATASLNVSTRTTRMLTQNQTPIIQQIYRNKNENDNENNHSVNIKAGNHILAFKRNKKEIEEFVESVTLNEEIVIEKRHTPKNKKIFKRSTRIKTLADLPPLTEKELKEEFNEVVSEVVQQSPYRIQVK